MAHHGSDSLRRIARQLREETAEHGRRAAEDLRERGEDARTELARLWSQIEDIVEHRLGPAARDVSRDAGRYAREGRAMAVDMTERLRGATAAHPLLAIGIAVATTWAVSRLLRGRR